MAAITANFMYPVAHRLPCIARPVRSSRDGTHKISQHSTPARLQRSAATPSRITPPPPPNQHSNTTLQHAPAALAAPTHRLRHPHSAIALQHASLRVLAPSASRLHRSRGPRIASSWRNQLRPRLPESAASASAPPSRCHRLGLYIATASAVFTAGSYVRLAGPPPQHQQHRHARVIIACINNCTARSPAPTWRRAHHQPPAFPAALTLRPAHAVAPAWRLPSASGLFAFSGSHALLLLRRRQQVRLASTRQQVRLAGSHTGRKRPFPHLGVRLPALLLRLPAVSLPPARSRRPGPAAGVRSLQQSRRRSALSYPILASATAQQHFRHPAPQHQQQQPRTLCTSTPSASARPLCRRAAHTPPAGFIFGHRHSPQGRAFTLRPCRSTSSGAHSGFAPTPSTRSQSSASATGVRPRRGALTVAPASSLALAHLAIEPLNTALASPVFAVGTPARLTSSASRGSNTSACTHAHHPPHRPCQRACSIGRDQNARQPRT
jgi:hypothetical protein